MIVKHNLTAMNSNRMLGLTTASQAKATEKLSSGYKINRAADDAAGLAISEKMRKQIRGLTQASLNAQDGISAVQTADGALNEVHDMVQRLTELSVKAANGTLSKTDRDAVQNEVDQLVAEIDRVSTTTKFNETHLLRGTNANGSAGVLTYTKAETGVADLDTAAGTGGVPFNTETGTVGLKVTSTTAAQNLTTPANASWEGKTVGPIGGTAYILVDSASGASVKEAIDAIEKNGAAIPTGATTYKAFSSMSALTSALKAAYSEDIRAVTTYLDGADLYLKAETFADLNSPIDLSLHVGADSADDNKIYMNISQLSARGLGLNGLKVNGDNDDNATAAIDTIADALQRVSNQRASLGAIQNRLEHTIANLDNIVENTTSAEASIRDTDMATQMVEYSNNQILAQAGQAMLAQANQATSGVMSLLQ
nr:flagellin [uncultured Acetatifactor sp.]